MPRRLRTATGGIAYHVLNRAVGRGWLFDNEEDFLAMQRVIERTQEQIPIRIASYCLMRNHWHFVLWPRKDGELSEFMRLLTVTHTQRWHAHHHTAGTGPVYQGRYKSFPIQQDGHFLDVCRYVERNAVRANLVRRARNWPWGSAAQRIVGSAPWLLGLNDWPVRPPRGWADYVDIAPSAAELEALRLCVKRSRPYGEPRWQQRIALRLCLESTLNPRGRQRIMPVEDSAS